MITTTFGVSEFLGFLWLCIPVGGHSFQSCKQTYISSIDLWYVTPGQLGNDPPTLPGTELRHECWWRTCHQCQKCRRASAYRPTSGGDNLRPNSEQPSWFCLSWTENDTKWIFTAVILMLLAKIDQCSMHKWLWVYTVNLIKFPVKKFSKDRGKKTALKLNHKSMK